MVVAPWLMVMALIVVQTGSSSAIEGLQSSSPEVRSRSVDVLEARGLASLPDLRALAASGPPEAANSAASLILRIGARRLRRGTQVPASVAPMPVLDAVRELARPIGSDVSLWIEPDSRWRFDKVALDQPGEVRFFEAIDLLGQRWGFRAGVESPVSDPSNFRTRFAVVDRTGAMPPTAYVGPYRVSLVKISRHRSTRLGKTPGEAATSEDFHALLEVAAEPGITIQPNGDPRLLEVVDDHGHDLRAYATTPSSPPEILTISDRTDQISLLIRRINLNLPEQPGRRIARLRGMVPIVAMTRTDEIFSIPLTDIQPRTIGAGGVTMQIQRVSMEGVVKVLDVTILGEPPPLASQFAAGPRQMTQATLALPFNLADHLRVEDAAGQPLSLTCVPSAPPTREGQMSYRIQIPAQAPHVLRYFGVAGVAVELPFDYWDLPIP